MATVLKSVRKWRTGTHLSVQRQVGARYAPRRMPPVDGAPSRIRDVILRVDTTVPGDVPVSSPMLVCDACGDWRKHRWVHSHVYRCRACNTQRRWGA